MQAVLKRALFNKQPSLNFLKSISNISKYSHFAASSGNRIINKTQNSTPLIRNLNSINCSSYSSKATDKTEIMEVPVRELRVPVPWGEVRGQIFGNPTYNATPILCLHGYLDNSNSFKPLAQYLCQNNEYYIIAVDFPGHGFSSWIPDGIAYTPKIFLTTVRRIVDHLNLKNFVFLSHSYGNGISLFYDTVFPNEAIALICLDWVFSMSSRKWGDISNYWKEGIDALIQGEKDIIKVNEDASKAQRVLTKEKAVQILMKANRHLDEDAAKHLIDRAVITKEDGKLDFSRDIRVKITMSHRDHYIDFVNLLPEICRFLRAPGLIIHAIPASYGDQSLVDTLKIIDEINEKSKTHIEKQTFNGTHHFHMINPKETSERVLKFLDKLKINPSTKL